MYVSYVLRLIIDRWSTLLQLFELVASSEGQVLVRWLLPPFTSVGAYDVIVTVLLMIIT